MLKVQIKTKLIADNNEMASDAIGSFQEEKEILTFQDQDAKITILLKDNILIRETPEAILSYKFSLTTPSRFEVFVKDMQKSGSLELMTEQLSYEENRYEVVYQLVGNEFKHHYIVEWRII